MGGCTRVKNIKQTSSEAPRASVTVSQAGRLGGLETLRRHGRYHFVRAGRLGQEVIAQLYTTEDRRRWGSLGGRPKKPRLPTTGGEGSPDERRYGSPPSHRPFSPQVIIAPLANDWGSPPKQQDDPR